MKKKTLLASLCALHFLCSYAIVEVPLFSEVHGYKNSAFTLSMSCNTPDAIIYYTTDCTTPSAQNGTRYTEPFKISKTATLRAVAVGPDGEQSELTAASYIFLNSVIQQSSAPKGYPSTWGPYRTLPGNAPADYGMDPELMDSQSDLEHVKNGIESLPAISIITEPGFLFSHEEDSERGGIYIYTGGDGVYGDGWLRAASIEFWESEHTLETYFAPQNDETGFQVNCAIKIHGNASREPEKTPKHSIRMKMKSDYGPKKLNYRLFGEKAGKKFNQIVLRAGFGNTWLHWLTGQQKQAMYTRDAWAKRQMSHLGHLATGTRYAHLFLNGMYWGIYNPTERIDDDFCELHMGGVAEDYDVVRYEYAYLETVDGTLDDYYRLLEGIDNCSDYATYQKLQGLDTDGQALEDPEVLFDPDNFIDYMLINYYGGNGDWDHHNWVAVHRHGADTGFKWLPWDSELVMQGVNDNAVKTVNDECPTGIFNKLMASSQSFRFRFVDRAYNALCEEFGYLQPDSVQAVWESLTEEIEQAMYAEAARWGDYRRDVHQYTSRGDLYTKPGYFDPQCRFMRDTYFPQRTDKVLAQLKNAGFWLPVENAPKLLIDNVEQKQYDVEIQSDLQKITLKGEATVYYTLDGSDPLTYTASGTPKANPQAMRTNSTIDIPTDCILKARVRNGSSNWSPLLVRNIKAAEDAAVTSVERDELPADETLYNLLGQPVSNPTPGIYIRNGRKILIK